MKKRMDSRRFWQGVDGYKLGVAVVLALVALFFLLVTIMPIILIETLEDAIWEFKTFATSYRPVAALIGLVLFLATGWGFLRVVRGPQVLPRVRRRAGESAEAAIKPGGGEQTGWSTERLIRSLALPWRRQGSEKPAASAAETVATVPPTPVTIESVVKPEKPEGGDR